MLSNHTSKFQILGYNTHACLAGDASGVITYHVSSKLTVYHGRFSVPTSQPSRLPKVRKFFYDEVIEKMRNQGSCAQVTSCPSVDEFESSPFDTSCRVGGCCSG